MGQFSWVTCDTKERILNGQAKNVYVLIPKEFGGGHIIEYCYDGYGNFGGCDIYDLVADWNRMENTEDNLLDPRKEYPNQEKWEEPWFKWAMERYRRDVSQLKDFRVLSDAEMQERYGKSYKREIGISIACLDRQNAALKYPIKIAGKPDSVYEDCCLSEKDANQGFYD